VQNPKPGRRVPQLPKPDTDDRNPFRMWGAVGGGVNSLVNIHGSNMSSPICPSLLGNVI
jgi:hypothetical protein